MKKFKLVFWNDVRWNTEISSVELWGGESNRDIFEGVIEEMLELEGEDWIDYVNGMVSCESDWVEDKEKWEGLFLWGDGCNENRSEFEIDFCNEFSSCLVIREDSNYFGYDFEGDDKIKLLDEVMGNIIN